MVKAAGYKVLREALESMGWVRFMQQFEDGYGDYTKEKYQEEEMFNEEVDNPLKTFPYLQGDSIYFFGKTVSGAIYGQS